jgi:class 3 adenylate cyclase
MAHKTGSKKQARVDSPLTSAIKADQPASAKAKVESYLRTTKTGSGAEDETLSVQDVESDPGTPKRQTSKVVISTSARKSDSTPAAPVTDKSEALVADSSDDDEYDGESRSKRSGSNGTVSSEGSQAAKNTGVSVIQLCGVQFRIPFTIWTLVAMLVPIILVATFTGISVDEAVKEKHVVTENTKLAVAIADCTTELTTERRWSAMYITAGVSHAARLSLERDLTDVSCNTVLTPLIGARAQWDPWMEKEIGRHQRRLLDLAALRSTIDTNSSTLAQSRDFFAAQIDNTTQALNHAASLVKRNSHVFFNLVMSMQARNYVSQAYQVGMRITSQPNKTSAVWGSDMVLFETAMASARAVLAVTELSVHEDFRSVLIAWETTGPGKVMLDRLNALNAAMYLKDEALVLGMRAQFEAEVGAGLDALHAIEKAHVNSIGSEAADKDLKSSLIFLVVGVLVCIVAAALLAWKQLQVKGQLERQVENISRTRKAVEAFVPRFFLRKMGYTSILQVKCGESTDVAVAMLFSDIRHFTTVSEGMTSSKLFDWIQGYFKRVTTIIERRHGNVNQFIGDALFAIFSHANDAAWCAADMQSSVQQLNVERQCVDPSSFPIEIGVGLHFDVVAMGILGDESRHTCTTISASVNLASRLEGLTKQFGSRIIASQEVIDQLTVGEEPGTGILRRCIGATMVKGSVKKVTIYDLFQTDERALYLYKHETRSAFERVAEGMLNGTITGSFIAALGDESFDPLASAASPPAEGSLPVFESMPGALNTDRAASSTDMTTAQSVAKPRATAAERQKQLHSTIAHPRRSPQKQHLLARSSEAAGRVHPDLALLHDAMARYDVHDAAVDAILQFTDGEGCMLLDNK